MRFLSFIAVLSLFLPQALRAETGAVADHSTELLTQAAKERAQLCAQIKSNPNCDNRERLLKSKIGMNVGTCMGELSGLKCDQFIQQFPQYANHRMRCEPYEICKLALESTLAEGCRRYGIEVKDGFVAFLNSQAECTTQWKCLLGRSLTTAFAMVAPASYLAKKSTEIADSTLKSFKDDRDRFQKMSCLDPETQAQFQCYLGVKYGGMVLGVAGAARAAGGQLMARMASLEKNMIAAETRAVGRSAAPAAKRSAASAEQAGAKTAAPKPVVAPKVTPEVLELETYLKQRKLKNPEAPDDVLQIAQGKGTLVIDYIEVSDTRMLALIQKAVRSGGLSTLDAGAIAGAKVPNFLLRLQEAAPAGSNFKIIGKMNPATLSKNQMRELVQTRAGKNTSNSTGTRWSEQDVANYERAVRDMKIQDACFGLYGRPMHECGVLKFEMNSNNPAGIRWSK